MASLPHGTAVLAVLSMALGSLAASASGEEKTVIADKTLVAWVAPANLTQRGGSVLTIEKPGGVFDAIVFGEIAPAKWMAGSDGFRRTKQEQEDFAGRDRRQPDAGADRHRLPGQADHALSQRQPSTPTTRPTARSGSAATAWS